jgi:hypothetical protein
MSNERKRCDKCRNRDLSFKEGQIRPKCKLDKPQFGGEEPCDGFDSRFIEYPITINGIDNHFNKDGLYSLHKCGQLVKISPCGDEYNGKTYLGILLGDLPIGAMVSRNRETKILDIYPHTNPAIFVPELMKIIYGCESWWGEIDNPEELKAITKDDIENVWYVKLLKELYEQK